MEPERVSFVCARSSPGAMNGCPLTVAFSDIEFFLLHSVGEIQTYQLEANGEVRWSRSLSEVAIIKLLGLIHGFPY